MTLPKFWKQRVEHVEYVEVEGFTLVKFNPAATCECGHPMVTHMARSMFSDVVQLVPCCAFDRLATAMTNCTCKQFKRAKRKGG